MKRKIQKVAVLGSGVMGTGIAAHLANCGIPSVLLDIVPKYTPEDEKAGLKPDSPAFRNKLSQQNLQAALKNRKPIPAFYHDKFAELITCGNFDDHMGWLAECDWVIEVVVENIDIKRKVFANVEKHMKTGAVVSSNTSGLQISAMTEGRGADFKKNFLVTHFFNPVRFMRLLEIIPGPETDPALVEFMARFGADVLGKGVVFGKDTVNFVANRIGVYSMLRAIKEMVDRDYTIEEVDAIVGQPMGRPRTALFGTADLVGMDVIQHIVKNCYEALVKDEEREVFKLPAFIDQMIAQGRLGNKTRGGFWKKEKGEGGKIKLVIDPKTGEYRPSEKVRIDSIGVAKNTDDPRKRLAEFVFADDRAGQFAWTVFRDGLIYAGNRLGEIADDIVQIDNGMRWGFNWDMGPFQAWDAVGFLKVAKRMEEDGKKLPPIALAMRKAKAESFYREVKGELQFFDLASKGYKPVPRDPLHIDLEALKRNGKEVAGNTAASLIDLGDGVLCCEFHSKMNSIDGDIIQLLGQGLDMLETDDQWKGMVIGNQGEHFCVGANVMLIFMAIQQAKGADKPEEAEAIWQQLEGTVKALQDTLMRCKYSPKPVVAAPFGMTLGGGAEVSMGADRICAHADLFMGLVEMGVGVIPGGGGNKELLIRHLEGIPELAQGVNLTPYLQLVFQDIGMAKVSMSAHEAVANGFLRATDRIVTNKDQLIGVAKNMVLGMHVEGYKQPLERKLSLPGEMGHATFKMVIDSMAKQHQITEYEQVMANKLAWVLTGGKTAPSVPVSERYLLDLEREAFMWLCRQEKTQERMQYFLMNNKPLRN
jgi:3-hydroxyacyl-CoA dehydrogenase